jgi:MFS family permease
MVLALTSAGVCFLINALSFVAVLVALLAMDVPAVASAPPAKNLLAGLREGFAYAFGFAPIRALLLLVAFVSLIGLAYAVLLPVFATRVLEGGAYTYGFLMSAAGVGALTGAILLASRKTVLGLGRWITAMPATLGIAIVGLSFAHTLLPALICVAVSGFAVMMQMASTNTVLQTIVDEDKRGRVMSLYTMAFMGTAPLGSLLAGYFADLFGAPTTVRVAGFCCIAASLVFATQFRTLRGLIRPIYRRMGILPEVATGIQEACQLTAPPEGK